MTIFTEAEKELLLKFAEYEDEFECESRKGMVQIKYVIFVPVRSNVPEKLKGYWIANESTCESYGYQDWDEYLESDCGWDKCIPVTITTKGWRKNNG